MKNILLLIITVFSFNSLLFASTFDIENTTPPEIVSAQKLASEGKRTVEFIKGGLENGYQIIWENGPVFAQKILDQYGTKASKMISLYEQAAAILVQDDPSYALKKSPCDYSKNEDGTVTIDLLTCV